MTVDELRTQMNNTYGLGAWPETLDVDYETYVNVCHAIFKRHTQEQRAFHLGAHFHVMFKGVELIPVRGEPERTP